MAIARLATSSRASSASTSVSVTFDIGSSTNMLLLAGFMDQQGPNMTTTTWNTSESLTNNNHIDTPSGSGTDVCYTWYRVAPTSGSHTLTGNTTSDSPFAIQLEAASYSGCKQTGVPNVSATASAAGSTTCTASFTTTADGCWGFGMARANAGSVSNGTNFTLFSGGSGGRAGDTNASLGTAGSKSMTMNGTAGGDVAMAVLAFAPVPVVNANFFMAAASQ